MLSIASPTFTPGNGPARCETARSSSPALGSHLFSVGGGQRCLSDILVKEQHEEDPEEPPRAQGVDELHEDGQAPVLRDVRQRVHKHAGDLHHGLLHAPADFRRVSAIRLQDSKGSVSRSEPATARFEWARGLRTCPGLPKEC